MAFYNFAAGPPLILRQAQDEDSLEGASRREIRGFKFFLAALREKGI